MRFWQFSTFYKVSKEFIIHGDNISAQLTHPDNALLYALTFLNLYKIQILPGLLVFILLLDAILEYFYQRRSDSNINSQ